MRRALPLLCLLLPACGWRAGLPAPNGADSVGVRAAEREGTVLERGLEPLLSDALSEAVEQWVALPIVAPAEADLVVTSRILEYRRRGGVRSQENELVETGVFVRVSAELHDRRTGNLVGQPVVAQQWSSYALDVPTNEDAARDRALRFVAETLVLELFDDRAPERVAPPEGR